MENSCRTMDYSPPGSSVGLFQQEYWSGLPFPSPGDLPSLGSEPVSPVLTCRFFTTEPPGKLLSFLLLIFFFKVLVVGWPRKV